MTSIPPRADHRPFGRAGAWYALGACSLLATIGMLYGIASFLIDLAMPTDEWAAEVAADPGPPDLAIAGLSTLAGTCIALLAAVHAAGSRRVPGDQRIPWVLGLLVLWPVVLPAYCRHHARGT